MSHTHDTFSLSQSVCPVAGPLIHSLPPTIIHPLPFVSVANCATSQFLFLNSQTRLRLSQHHSHPDHTIKQKNWRVQPVTS